jgi:CheY-like chemotaxis protein
MHQVFLNLFVNARDAMPVGGEIKVTAENRVLNAAQAANIEGGRAGDFILIEVRDTGTGIPPEVLERMFDPFFTTKGEGKGTGLGLSTVRAIVSNHDGFLAVHTSAGTDPGHGATFSVYLPAAAGETAESSKARGDQARQGRGELVLFVDDEQPVLDIGAKILIERGGYRVITAHNGADAAAAFVPRSSEVRLLVTDLDMPLVDGRSLALALRLLRPELPVVIMSGGALETEEGLRKFATAFLAKPFEAQSLLEVVHRTLQKAGSASPIPPKT